MSIKQKFEYGNDGLSYVMHDPTTATAYYSMGDGEQRHITLDASTGGGAYVGGVPVEAREAVQALSFHIWPRPAPKPAEKDAIIAILRLQGLAFEEVTDANVAVIRKSYVVDAGPGNLVWRVNDPTSKRPAKFAVVYCTSGRPGPHNGGVGAEGEKGIIIGQVYVDDDDAVIFLQTKSGAKERMNGF